MLLQMQFSFMQPRGTRHAIVKKLYICFVNMEKAFDRVPKKKEVAKNIEKRSSQELKDLLDLKEPFDKLAKTNGVR